VTDISGISAFCHDSTATLVIDGEIFAATQEERVTRKKHDPDFPRPAIARTCQRTGRRNLSLPARGAVHADSNAGSMA
jgi:carbamoyltransferase